MPHNQCPPNRRGHTWRPAEVALLPEVPRRDLSAFRVCQYCGKIGRINKQGIVEIATIAKLKERVA